jgi:hypothetical protein
MEHETRFELATHFCPRFARPSVPTRCSHIALSSPFRWHAINRKGPNSKPTAKLRAQKNPATLRATRFLCVEHETRFELATLTLARKCSS